MKVVRMVVVIGYVESWRDSTKLHNLKSQPNGPVIELGLPFLQVTVLVKSFHGPRNPIGH